MAERLFYSKAGNQFGPVTANVLRQLARAGELRPTDKVTREGTDRWVDASRVKGLFPATNQVAPQPTPSTQKDDHYPLDVVTPPVVLDVDTPEPEGKGRLELDAATRFVLTHPLGLPAWLIFMASATFILALMLMEEPHDSRGPMPEGLIAIIVGLFAVAGMGIYAGMKINFGKKTACPRCNRWFSKLLVKSDARVIDSREETRTYTGQAAIRDRNFRVTGYVDEQRTMPVTVKTVVGYRKYRCKACSHRWEVSDVGNVVD